MSSPCFFTPLDGTLLVITKVLQLLPHLLLRLLRNPLVAEARLQAPHHISGILLLLLRTTSPLASLGGIVGLVHALENLAGVGFGFLRRVFGLLVDAMLPGNGQRWMEKAEGKRTGIGNCGLVTAKFVLLLASKVLGGRDLAGDVALIHGGRWILGVFGLGLG
ncbi:hypothetical protein VTI74DRAFT_4664 [Chaetomium olivicolor]